MNEKILLKSKKTIYACECLKLKENDLIQAARDYNLNSIENVTDHYKITWGCGDCFEDIQLLLDSVCFHNK